ncbi:MAG: CARDB domain-containing protein, partial [Anaerolineae bacterium]|nr:CARDB domain-containing protein [Anaerolineae bacterium]
PPTPGPSPTATPTPTPTPTPSPVPCTPTGIDLVVTSISVRPNNPRAGEEAIVSVTIKNQGSSGVRAGNNFYVDFYVDRLPARLLQGDLYWGVQGAWLPAGASHTLSATFVFDPGSHNLYAMVDTDNSVDECPHEGNNSYGPAGLSVAASALNPGEPAGTVEPTAAPTMLVPRGTPTPQPGDHEP